MSASAQLQPVQERTFRHSSGPSAGAQRVQQRRPQTSTAKPATTPRVDAERYRELKRKASHRASILCTIGVVTVAGAIFGICLGGHIQLADEAHRSVVVSNALNQAIEQSHYWQNERAKQVTPTAINQRAGTAGMVHPDERETIAFR